MPTLVKNAAAINATEYPHIRGLKFLFFLDLQEIRTHCLIDHQLKVTTNLFFILLKSDG